MIPERFPHVRVCGLEITACCMDDVEPLMERAVKKEVIPQALATVNLNFLRLAFERPLVRETLQGFAHRFADGWPVLALAKRAGHPLPERVTGSDLTPRIFAWAAEKGWRVGLVGASELTRTRLREIVPARFGPVVVDHWVPRYGDERSLADPGLATAIREGRLDVLLVALGAPKQELWIRHNFAETSARVAIGVGASLDFLAGTLPRAPRAFQRLRLEWLFRLACEPRRLGGRYFRDFLFYARGAPSASDRAPDRPAPLDGCGER